MNTTELKDAQQKAHADNTGLTFAEYIADFDNATPEQRAQDGDVSQLDSLHDDLNLPTNHINNTRFLHDNLSGKGGSSIGDKAIGTQGGYALVMLNNKFEPVNAAAHMPNNDSPPFISDTTQSSAYTIGSMSHDSDWWLVVGLSDAVTLYAALAAHDSNVTVLACLNQSLYDKALRHFAKVKTINITDTAQHKNAITSRLSGVNAIAHITPIDLFVEMLKRGELTSAIIDQAENIDLSTLSWGEPETLASDPSKPTPYPIDAFTGLLRQVIEAVAYYAQVPLAMAGQCVLGALAHMGQRFIDAPFGHSHKPASLILITEGESGSGKTESVGLTHFKIEQHERQQYEEYLQDLEVWEIDKAALKGAELKEYLTNTPKPINPKNIFDDATIEPILDKFVDGDISNASWSTDEAAQFFNGHTMKGDTAGNALGAITKLYSNGRASRQRSQKSAYATPRTDAYDVRLTLLLQGQRVILEPALTDPLMNGQGFLARALIACPEDLRGQRVWNDPKRNNDDPHDNPYLIEYWERCHSLLEPSPVNEPTDLLGNAQRIKIQFADKHTQQAFNDLAQAIEVKQKHGQTFEYVKAYASRMAENASRIASLMAFFEGRVVITTDDIRRAFILVEYSTAERLRYLDATPTGEQSDLEKLSIWLISKVKGKNPAVLNKSFVSQNAPNALRGKKLNFLLEDLQSMGHIKLESEGRKRLVYVNPNLIID